MKKNNIYDDLKRRILTLDLAPGAALDEVSLSQTYGISRTPLRDILRQLAGEGYVEIFDNRGASVARMDHTTLRHFFMTAPTLYALIGRLAAENATALQIKQLSETQKQFASAMKATDQAGMVYWNDQFHRQMGYMSGNPYLIPSYERLLIDHARISQTFYKAKSSADKANLSQACDQHDAMIAAITSGDSDEIVELIKSHWSLSRQNIERYIYPDPLPMEDS